MKGVKFLLSALLMILICGCSEDEVASFGSITGIVTDANSGEPVTSAIVALTPGNSSVQTDASGSYSFKELDPGTYTIQVKASNYETSTTSASVTAGMSTKCDVKLNSSSQQASIELSTSTVTFDKGVNEMTFTINNTGKSGSVSWSISGVTVDWLTILPRTGTTAQGASSTIKLTVDRSKISDESSAIYTNIIVEGTSFSKSVSVVVNNVISNGNQGSGNDNSGSNSGNNDNNQNSGNDDNQSSTSGEDYSSAKITSFDSKIKVELLSCKRNEDIVTLNFRLTNDGLGLLDYIRFQGVDGSNTVIWTDDSQQYYEWTFNLNGQTASYKNDLNVSIPDSAPCNGYLKVTGISSSAKTLNASIRVYNFSGTDLEGKNLKFLDVPIY
jgi:hypothetical protein